MSIDWFTFTAQIVNFLILIWLLNRLLYGPITRAMAEREKRIAGRFADAEAAQSQAAQSQRQYEDQLNELAQTKETLIAEAGQDVKTWRAEHLHRAKADVEDNRQQWQQELTRDKQALFRELQLDVTHHAVELGRHVLQELADQRLQTRMVERFLSRLNDTDLTAIRPKPSGSGAAAPPLTVQSSHELTDRDRADITAALKDVDAEITFQMNPGLICGIEILSPGCRFTWNLRESLAEVESGLIDALKETLPTMMSEHGESRSDPHRETVAS